MIKQTGIEIANKAKVWFVVLNISNLNNGKIIVNNDTYKISVL
jgi:hypothetical protein